MFITQNFNNVLQCEKLDYKTAYSIGPKELRAGTQTNICIPLLIAALFTTANRWEQTKYPTADELITQNIQCNII